MRQRTLNMLGVLAFCAALAGCGVGLAAWNHYHPCNPCTVGTYESRAQTLLAHKAFTCSLDQEKQALAQAARDYLTTPDDLLARRVTVNCGHDGLVTVTTDGWSSEYPYSPS